MSNCSRLRVANSQHLVCPRKDAADSKIGPVHPPRTSRGDKTLGYLRSQVIVAIVIRTPAEGSGPLLLIPGYGGGNYRRERDGSQRGELRGKLGLHGSEATVGVSDCRAPVD